MNAHSMRPSPLVLAALLVALPAAASGHQRGGGSVSVRKCCGENEMLAGDAKSCVQSGWPPFRGAPISWFASGVDLPSLDADWVRRWLPPGLPPHGVRVLMHSFYGTAFLRQRPSVARVNASSVWDEQLSPDEGWWGGRVVLKGGHPGLLRRRPGGGLREAALFCVDAAGPPLAPFALLFKTLCTDEECVTKCCGERNVLVNDGGQWLCRRHGQRNWSPFNSSLAESVDGEFPFRIRASRHPVQLAGPVRRSAAWARTSKRRRLFSTWHACFDYYFTKRTFQEGLFFREESHVARGVYWLVRPLCTLSALLLTVSVLSIACNSRMRRTMHGWCLCSHATCLLLFNVGQVVYYLTISDVIDKNKNEAIFPSNLRTVCKHFALSMYFLLMAAWSWLTILCANLSMGFSIQAVPPKSGKKRFLAFSAFAWGFPALLAVICSILFIPAHNYSWLGPNKASWYNPSLVETRVCYREHVTFILSTGRSEGYFSTIKHATALFYYCPVSCLVGCNAGCIAVALSKMHRLRTGSSLLRREEGHAGARGGGGAKQRPALGAKAIKIYIKLILMSGAIELVSEIISWMTMRFSHEEVLDYDLAYLCTGYVTDFVRAGGVAWLAAPEGGYFGAIARRLRKQDEEAPTEPLACSSLRPRIHRDGISMSVKPSRALYGAEF